MGGIGASQGIQAWLQAFNQSSASVVRATASSAQPTANAGSELIDGMVGTSLDAIGVRAGVSVVRTQDEMLGTLLDMLA